MFLTVNVILTPLILKRQWGALIKKVCNVCLCTTAKLLLTHILMNFPYAPAIDIEYSLYIYGPSLCPHPKGTPLCPQSAWPRAPANPHRLSVRPRQGFLIPNKIDTPKGPTHAHFAGLHGEGRRVYIVYCLYFFLVSFFFK